MPSTPQEHIDFMRGFSEDHEPDGWPAVRMLDVSRLCDIAESVIPAIDRLEDRLRQGPASSRRARNGC